GQILDEVYVYGSFIQSRKYHQGVRCSDCHDPHTARLRVQGNDLCNGCHGLTPSKQFTTIIPQNYDSPEHHFHKPDSTGAFCVECHMPETRYMVVDPRRDHSFRIPRPDLTIKLDIPNACNRCHEDKTARWAMDKVNEWYPLSKDIQEDEIHFAEIIAAGQAGKPKAAPSLIKLAGDLSQPAIIRATALHILQNYNNEQTLNIMSSSLNDIDALVRHEAVNGISALMQGALGVEIQERKLSLLVPLLNDPIRAVRTEAARVLTEMSTGLTVDEQLPLFVKALDEYKQRQQSIADRPESHLNLGLIYQNMEQNKLAETSYKNAIRLVPDFIPARFNLANLYNALGRNKDAEHQFKQIIELEPDNGEAYYSMGLLLAEEKRLEEAADNLEKAAVIIKTNPRIFYNLALCLQSLGRQDEAETAYLTALDIAKEDYSIMYALTIFYIQQQRWKEASVHAEHLWRLNSNSSEVKEIVEFIRQNIDK
ncbi:MAG: tetratricopeptide repeat protein, partial [Gammaproteobacteria bacterium]|nr:tetratricopeptide repeat protein [Gammaproteobacteria bacterium]